jgi:hypothetical protein
VYGGRIVLLRVERLTPTEFEENPVATVEPFEGSPYPDGLHTLCPVGEVTLVDGKRRAFVSQALAGKAVHLLRRLTGRLAGGTVVP